MNRLTRLKRAFPLTPIAAAIALAGTASAQVKVTSDFTGIWDQPDQESQGFVVQIVGQPDGSTEGVAYWFTYDDAGNPLWVVGQGPVEGDQINLDFVRVDGPQFLEANNPNARSVSSFGSGTMKFSSCNEATVDVQLPGAVTGTGLESFRMSRLASVLNRKCSGGITDNFVANAPAEEVEIDLVSTGVEPGASGEAELETGPGYASFEVEVEGLAAGSYDLLVGGAVVGSITVEQDGDDTSGDIEFDSPADGDELLLSFEPRGQVIEVAQNGTILLSSNPVPQKPVGNVEEVDIEVDFDNLGVYPQASGEVSFEINGARREFEIDVEDLPLGDYPVQVGGLEVGLLMMELDDDGDLEGELEFGNPADDDEILLTFDPRGQLVEILDAAGPVLAVEFPDESDDDDSGDDSDDGSDDDSDDGSDDDSDDGSDDDSDDGSDDDSDDGSDDDSDDGSDDDSDDGSDDDSDDSDDGSDDGNESVDLSGSFVNTGANPDAEGEFSFQIEGGDRDASLELSGLADGSYEFAVDGSTVLTVTVEDGEADVDFGDPVDEDDEVLLTFDPRGRVLSIRQGGTEFLTLNFPS